MNNISIRRAGQGLIVIVCAVLVCAALRLPGLAVPVFAEPQGRTAPGGPCQADGEFRAYHLAFADFEVPRNWLVMGKGEDIFVGPRDGGCGLGLTLASDRSMGGFEYDPATADRVFLTAHPGWKLHGRVFGVSIGNEVPGKRMTLAFTNRGVPGRIEILVAVGGNLTFSAGFMVIDESLYAKNEALAERVLASVRVKSPILNPTAAVAAVPQRVVDVASAKTFQNGQFSFKYPGTWSKKSEGRDPEEESMLLVQFASPDGAEVLEVRYRAIAPGQRFTSLGWQLTQTAARHFGQFWPSPDYPTENFAAGPVQTEWLRKDLAGSSMEVIGAYAYDRTRVRALELSDLSARQLVMSSFRFSSAPTLVGEWIRQGEGVNLRADHTYERYEIRSQTSTPTIETGTYEISGNRLVFRKAGGGPPRDESCALLLRGDSLSFCDPEFRRR
jgi:hypothetical protein